MINNSLASSTIHRTTSAWSSPVLFTLEKEQNLWSCFYYQQLNMNTMKNKYPLLLKMELVDILFEADKYTKLDICNTYGNLIVATGGKYTLVFLCQEGQCDPVTIPFGPTGVSGYFLYFIHDTCSTGEDRIQL